MKYIDLLNDTRLQYRRPRLYKGKEYKTLAMANTVAAVFQCEPMKFNELLSLNARI